MITRNTCPDDKIKEIIGGWSSIKHFKLNFGNTHRKKMFWLKNQEGRMV